MAYIGRQLPSGAFLKLDSIKPLFNGNRVTFPLTLGGEAFFPGNPFSLLVSLSGVIQEPISAFTIADSQITFASAPTECANFFCVVLATTNVAPLKTLTIGARSGAQVLDLHGRKLAVSDRSGIKHTISLNLS